MKIIHFDPVHALIIYRKDGTLGLSHHDQIMLEIRRDSDEIKVLKKLYNRIVKNHYELNIFYRKEDLESYLEKFPVSKWRHSSY